MTPSGHVTSVKDNDIVVSFGNPYRRDDGVGEAIVHQVLKYFPDTKTAFLEDPMDLLGVWDSARLAILVDAMRSGDAAGTLSVCDISEMDINAGEEPVHTDLA